MSTRLAGGDSRSRLISCVDFTAISLVKSDHLRPALYPACAPARSIRTERSPLPPAAKSLYFWSKIGSARDLLYQPTIGGSADS